MSMRSSLPAAAVTALALAFGAGCGDDEPGTPVTAGDEATPTQEQQAAADGKQLFSDTCGGCHTLKAAGTNGQVGPVLDEVKPNEDVVLTAIQQGPGTMPENLLEGEEAEAVAKYVADNAGN